MWFASDGRRLVPNRVTRIQVLDDRSIANNPPLTKNEGSAFSVAPIHVKDRSRSHDCLDYL